MGRDWRGPLRPRPDQCHARRGSNPHGAGEVRQEAIDRRAGQMGPRKPQSDCRTPEGPRLRERAATDQGLVRRSRGHANGPYPDLGRQKMEYRVGLDHGRRFHYRAHGEGGRGKVCGRKEAHARVSRDQLMSVNYSAALRPTSSASPVTRDRAVVNAVPYELVSAAKFPDIPEFTGNFLQFTGNWP